MLVALNVTAARTSSCRVARNSIIVLSIASTSAREDGVTTDGDTISRIMLP